MLANQSTKLLPDIEPLDFLYQPQTLSIFEAAANQFIKAPNGTTEIWAASNDWFLEEWGRDTFIALSGLLLTRGRYREAREVFEHFAKYERNGLIPNAIRESAVLYNTADASLWYITALNQYLKATADHDFIERMMPTIRSIIDNYINGTEYERFGNTYQIALDSNDCLIYSPAQASWMDADPSENGESIVTPRKGKCVEINALWYAALRFAVELRSGGQENKYYAELAEKVKSSFANRFWNDQNGYLFDVIDSDAAAANDAALRPNQVIAISHGYDLIDPDQQFSILTVIKNKLLTPGGLRTLSPDDPHYHGSYNTSDPIPVKDLAYHQGTAWPWLIGPYCDALEIVLSQRRVPAEKINRAVAETIAPLVKFCIDSEFKSLPELFSGNPPYDPGGTTSQAWSVAEVLRILKKLTKAGQ